MNNNLNDIASKSLGSSSSYAVYSDKVDKTLLNPMPRELARKEHDIIESEFGFDVWHSYEATFLKNTGEPCSGILKFIFPSLSKYMIESKSLKLYLNTYDMVKFNSVYEYVKSIKTDLSEVLETHVEVKFFNYNDGFQDSVSDLYNLTETSCNREITNYTGNYTIEKSNNKLDEVWVHSLYTTGLRSRCRHTKQKDSGAVYIQLKTDMEVNYDDILEYIYSLREVNEFHEFCCEKIYSELKRAYGGKVNVYCFYVRRGGIDINPCRIDYYENDDILDIEILIKGFYGQ